MPNADPALRRGARRDRAARARGRGRVAMRPGEIEVDGVSRKFVVRARETHTLKELLVARGRTGAQEVWALRDVSLAIEPGEAVGLVGRNGSGKSTLLRLIAGIILPTAGSRRDGRPGRLAARARRRVPPRLHGARERRAERRAAGPDTRADPRAIRRDRRVRGDRACDRPAGAHVLVRDDDAARVRDRRRSSRRTCSCSTRCSRSVTRASSGSASASSPRSRSRAARSCSSLTTPRPWNVCATERCCCATAESRSTGASTRRSPGTGGRSRRTETVPGAPNDVGPAGTGEARLAGVRLVAQDGEPRERFLAGEPFGLEIDADRRGGRVVRSISRSVTGRGCSSPRRSSIRGARLERLGRRRRAPLRRQLTDAPVRALRRRTGARRRGRTAPRPAAARPSRSSSTPTVKAGASIRLEGTWRRDAKDVDR